MRLQFFKFFYRDTLMACFYICELHYRGRTYPESV
jgi:hypothetical protein